MLGQLKQAMGTKLESNTLDYKVKWDKETGKRTVCIGLYGQHNTYTHARTHTHTHTHTRTHARTHTQRTVFIYFSGGVLGLI